ncbi:NAD(P)/FAD-dependent oxidoreductase [Vibrio europaeus]|uniref:NAD(P)/FAD-dependent oxidoreductase n=1 Tax=Vibrio europaeus TaxID=300876 RepID=A0A178J7U6_9VIBR|nr:NAD(P)/FAD-dependent oxidoreductase [Vibrio europaeus]MDC5705548.1 NAD(P)/FAD-dependent oxidoreductase [Vibrio europaeus]MDC5710827.1 NAD(P)/FAD-dependent oxidoreductase [Vibrio europaeus]MDC5715917.1 NAD(P)/FAD-dependent oxidoreductase [Vibrio europaeus]MDC5720079.1 NAD(P)/FAD-dependent oxidoreductase [Vibrio europaeus]MDC5724034.1 NAD(P)/FAD-dependent oxidoreductase [Vibrio europaeus]
MIRLNEIKLPLDHEEEALTAAITKKLGISIDQVISYNVFRRGYDARKKANIFLIYTLDVIVENEAVLLEQFVSDPHVKETPDMEYKFVAKAPENITERPVVIGFGPCGLFAALILAQAGFKPIVVERGKEVRERTKDTFGFWRKRTLNTESNVQFGEGGAGTFSDGKLYSQVKDPNFYGRKVTTEFVAAGAPEEIMYVSKPHIGTFKLVTMIEKMRAKIIELGGEIRFSTRVDDIHMDGEQITGLTLSNGEEIKSRYVVLAVGHSARDTFEMLHDRGVYMEAKPFSVGFRIEHKQSMIDEARFGKNAGNPILGAADYKLVHHCKNGRTVYSFCMCPGGTVVAATSEEGRVVTNGMSQYSRSERNANSAIVVGIDPERDYPGDPLAGIRFQRELESGAYVLGGENYDAPAQKIGDFLKGRDPSEIGDVQPSFTPGIHLTDISKALPDFAIEAIREAIPAFDKKIKGFASDDGLLTGVETRTSSPVCIKRGKDFQSINLKGFYPAGEGAGYAGGILSAGIDGIKVAEALSKAMVADLENA